MDSPKLSTNLFITGCIATSGMLQRKQPMKQLKFSIEWIECRHYQNCDAPLCPEDINVKHCLWFPGEPICRLRTAPEWVAKQKKISRLEGIDSEKCFTVRMLERIEEIKADIEGANPETAKAEAVWLARQTRKSGKKKQEQRKSRSNKKEPGNYTLF